MKEIIITVLIAIIGLISGWINCFDITKNSLNKSKRKLNKWGYILLASIALLTITNVKIVQKKDIYNEKVLKERNDLIHKQNKKLKRIVNSNDSLKQQLIELTIQGTKSGLLKDYENETKVLINDIESVIDLVKMSLMNSIGRDSIPLDTYKKLMTGYMKELCAKIQCNSKDALLEFNDLFGTASYINNYNLKPEIIKNQFEKYDLDKKAFLKDLYNIREKNKPKLVE